MSKVWPHIHEYNGSRHVNSRAYKRQTGKGCSWGRAENKMAKCDYIQSLLLSHNLVFDLVSDLHIHPEWKLVIAVHSDMPEVLFQCHRLGCRVHKSSNELTDLSQQQFLSSFQQKSVSENNGSHFSQHRCPDHHHIYSSVQPVFAEPRRLWGLPHPLPPPRGADVIYRDRDTGICLQHFSNWKFVSFSGYSAG